MNNSLYFSPTLVARQPRAAAWLIVATKERDDIVDTMASPLTEQKPVRTLHWAVTVEGG